MEHPRLFGGSLGKLMSDIAANSMFWPLDVLIDVQLVLAGLFFFYLILEKFKCALIPV